MTLIQTLSGAVAPIARPLALAFIAMMLAGCGLKGDLYLPPEPAESVPEAEPAPEETDDEKEKDDAR